MHGEHKTPLVGWHPSADLVAYLDAEVERRGGGRGIRSAVLEEALAGHRDRNPAREKPGREKAAGGTEET